MVSRTVESSAGRRSEIKAVSARTSVGCSRSRTWRSSSAESWGCNSRSRLSRSCVSISCQSTVGCRDRRCGRGGSAARTPAGGDRRHRTEQGRRRRGAGRTAYDASATVARLAARRGAGCTRGRDYRRWRLRQRNVQIERGQRQPLGQYGNRGVVGHDFAPGCVSRSRSVALRGLVAIFHFDCGRLKSVLTIALETRARTPSVVVIARHDFDHSFKASEEIFGIGRYFVIESQQNVAVGCRAGVTRQNDRRSRCKGRTGINVRHKVQSGERPQCAVELGQPIGLSAVDNGSLLRSARLADHSACIVQAVIYTNVKVNARHGPLAISRGRSGTATAAAPAGRWHLSQRRLSTPCRRYPGAPMDTPS